MRIGDIGVRWLLATIVLLSCASSSRGGDTLVTPATGDSIEGRLRLTDSTSQRLVVPIDRQDGWMLDVQLGDRRVTLELEANRVRAEGARLLVELPDGSLTSRALPPAATYRGRVAERAGSQVALAFVDAGVRALIDLGQGELWALQPAREIDATAAADLHVSYPETAVRHSEHRCGGGMQIPDAVPLQSAYSPRVNCIRRTQIAFDADASFYRQNGSSESATVADIESVVNAMNLIFRRDINVEFEITTTIVRTTDTIYNVSDIGQLLDQLQTEWTTTQSAVVRDLAHLMTGQPTGGYIGLAYVNVLCNFNYEYGVSQSRFTTDLIGRVGLTAHELGHNFNAGHCDGDPDCSIMCSGIGGCANNLLSFSANSAPVMRQAAITASCLQTDGPSPTAAPPGAINDIRVITSSAPVTIDVLANDSDPNCQTMTIQSFRYIHWLWGNRHAGDRLGSRRPRPSALHPGHGRLGAGSIQLQDRGPGWDDRRRNRLHRQSHAARAGHGGSDPARP
jgi:hypothetical protein